jgi:hypothetical protein
LGVDETEAAKEASEEEMTSVKWLLLAAWAAWSVYWLYLALPIALYYACAPTSIQLRLLNCNAYALVFWVTYVIAPPVLVFPLALALLWLGRGFATALKKLK